MAAKSRRPGRQGKRLPRAFRAKTTVDIEWLLWLDGVFFRARHPSTKRVSRLPTEDMEPDAEAARPRRG